MEEIIFGTYKKNAAGKSCLILGKNRDSYEEEMLREAKPDGFLKLMRQEQDNYVYDISGKKALPAAFERVPMNAEQLIKIVTGILETIERAGEFLLNSESFVLLPEYIYLKLPEYEVQLCYYPEYHVPVFRQLSKLLETFLNRVDYREKRAISLVYSLYMLLQEPDVTMEQIKARLLKGSRPAGGYNRKPRPAANGAGERAWQAGRERTEWTRKQEAKEKWTNAAAAGRQVEDGASYRTDGASYRTDVASYRTDGASYRTDGVSYRTDVASHRMDGAEGRGRQGREPDRKKKEVREKKKSFFGNLFPRSQPTDEPVFLDEQPSLVAETPSEWGEHTRVLSVSEIKTEPSLVSEKSGEAIYLKKFPFFIGSAPEYSDFVIEQDTVSRFHAKLVQTDGEVMLFDLNSTNGTMVNETAVPLQQGIRLRDGDRITFAKETYRFFYGGKKQP